MNGWANEGTLTYLPICTSVNLSIYACTHLSNNPTDQAYSYVRESNDATATTTTSWTSLESLGTAFLASKRALQLSERAFFDPSMVGMLYFPVEHQYAIYAPLFFPMAVPMLFSLVREWNRFRANRRAAARQRLQQLSKAKTE